MMKTLWTIFRIDAIFGTVITIWQLFTNPIQAMENAGWLVCVMALVFMVAYTIKDITDDYC